MTTSATFCPDCHEPTPTGGWVDQQGRTHHVGCGDPLGVKARDKRIAELEAVLKQCAVAIGSLPDEALGFAGDDDDRFPVAHELLRRIGQVLNT